MVSRLKQIIDRYEQRERELKKEADALRGKLEDVERRLDEARIMREDAEHLLAGHNKTAAAPAAASAPKASSQPAKSTPAPAATAPAASKGVSDGAIRKMGIVDAAIALAKRNNKEIADAGDVLQWFEDIGYESRNGLPSRNSVYVSLNRETKNQDDSRIERHDRGQFKFNFN